MTETGPEPRRHRVRIGVGAGIVLVLVALACAVLAAILAPKGQVQSFDPVVSSPLAEAGGDSTLLVHVLGAVHRPGLYELAEGARAVDAVSAAGGFLDTADQAQLNLARFVSDAEQLYVPTIGETVAPGSAGVVAGLVNINTADAAALETLPRVGPAMAASIIEWRETNGRFSALEDLLNVSGIGQKTFDGLKDLVTT